MTNIIEKISETIKNILPVHGTKRMKVNRYKTKPTRLKVRNIIQPAIKIKMYLGGHGKFLYWHKIAIPKHKTSG